MIPIENYSFGKLSLFIGPKAKGVYLKSWFDAGVYNIEHLIASDGKFLTYKEFINSYNVKSEILVFYGMI
jgi:hypothetical protein